ncbi:MAG: helix-turn-helix domain-containing protein [Rhizobiales bacterium]|nr:helix-turn-helix domain-containing protein [Hyphomicrobiales bacterium]
MSETPDQRTYVLEVLARTGLKQTELAKRAGLDPSTLSRFLSSHSGPRLRLSTIRRIEKLTGLPFSAGTSPPDGEAHGFSESEALLLADNVPDVVAVVLNHLRATHGSVDAWTLKSRALELGAYRAGDILFVKLAASPLKGDVVCAQIYDWSAGRTETVFRIFDPPYLISATADPKLFAPYALDDERVGVKGVVLHCLRNR